jgi:hypothetical protein
MIELDDVQTIYIAGGLQPDATGDIAAFGDVLLEREAGETIERFQIRAREAAVAAGCGHVIFGGLRPMNFDDDPTVDQPKGE